MASKLGVLLWLPAKDRTLTAVTQEKHLLFLLFELFYRCFWVVVVVFLILFLPSLRVTVHLTSLGCPPTLLISRPAVEAAQIIIWSYSFLFLPPMYTALRASVFSFVGALSALLYIPQTVCLVDPVDLICSLYSWWEGFGSYFLVTLPLGFNCGFISTSACGSPTGICSWGCPGGLGFALVRARYGGGAAAWVTGVLAAPCTVRGWHLGQQKI